ncbi:hypothetical protein WDV93_08120 [Pantoea ananatis]
MHISLRAAIRRVIVPFAEINKGVYQQGAQTGQYRLGWADRPEGRNNTYQVGYGIGGYSAFIGFDKQAGTPSESQNALNWSKTVLVLTVHNLAQRKTGKV